MAQGRAIIGLVTDVEPSGDDFASLMAELVKEGELNLLDAGAVDAVSFCVCLCVQHLHALGQRGGERLTRLPPFLSPQLVAACLSHPELEEEGRSLQVRTTVTLAVFPSF